MKEQAMSKNTAIEKLKSGSVAITVICWLAVPFNLIIGFLQFCDAQHLDIETQLNKYMVYRSSLNNLFGAVIMAVAALLFARIAKDGMPFTQKYFRSVRTIGILFLVNAVIPSVSAAGIIGTFKGVGGLVNPSALMEGMLFLFLAHIIRYGAMLQQESDETL